MEETVEGLGIAFQQAINDENTELSYTLLSRLRVSGAQVSVHLLPPAIPEPESVPKRAQALRDRGVPIPECQEIAKLTTSTEEAIKRAQAKGLIPP